MSSRNRSAVIRLASAITEEPLIDWDQEKVARPELVDTFDCLRVVEEIVRGYRSIGEPSVVRSGRSPRAERFQVAPKSTPSHPGPPLFTWGPLRALEKIGEGTFGDVYRAHDPLLERDVALKLLRRSTRTDASMERFLLEARRLARVRHPNVLVVHGADVHDGQGGMWTDLIQGQTLERLLEQHGPWGAKEAALLAIELCGALAAVHASGLVHRDVKTSNVMREVGGRIVLMDFGAVAELTADGARGAKERLIGTPLMLAPELLAGAPGTPATDVYALGVLVYRLLTAAYPVEARTLEELLAQHRRGARIALRERRPDLPAPFVRAVEMALEPAAAARYQGVGELEWRLADSLGLTATRATTRTKGSKSKRRDIVHADRLPPGVVPHNLPEAVTRFVGRDGELATCLRLLSDGRWLTLVGPSGHGKTRLALRLAEASLEEFRDGVWFVDLELSGDADAGLRRLAGVLDVRDHPGKPRIEAVADRLRDAQALVVLDHCDEVIEATAAWGSALLLACSGVKLLVTSCSALGASGERVHVVPPLPAHRAVHDDLGPGAFEPGAPRPGLENIGPASVSGAQEPSGAGIRDMASVPFVGREHELERLENALEGARLRSGSTIILNGEAGVGKSRLMMEFRRLAEARGLLCLGGRCSFHGGRNFEPFVEALEEFARRFGTGRGGMSIGTPASRFGSLFTTLETHQDLASEPISREHVWSLLDTLLRRISKYETLALMLDDLHWADEGTLALLNHITRNLGSSRLLIVGSYRSEEIGPTSGQQHRLADVMQLLSTTPRFVQLPLPPLDRSATRSLVERMLDGAAQAREWGSAIHDHSQGNPFFTIEIVRDLAGRSGLGSGSIDDLPSELVIPPTVTGVLMRRLGRLSTDERDVLDVAAVEGDSFHTDTVAAGTGAAGVTLLKRLRALSEVHHLILPIEDGHRFTHGLVREVVLRAMPRELRREYHAVVATHLMKVHGDRPDYAGRIGEQLLEAGRLAEAVPFLLAAAREARRLFLNERALAFLERALEAQTRSTTPASRQGEILRAKCEVLLLLGRPHDARRVAEEALEVEERGADGAARAAAQEALGDAALAEGDLVSAETLLMKARERYAAGADLRPIARCDQKLGATATRRGDFMLALRRLNAALECSKDAGDPRDESRIRLDLGDVLYKRGDYEAALEMFETAVSDLRRFDQRHDLVRGLTRLGNALFQSGQPDPAFTRYDEALALAARLGDVQGVARLEANLGNVHLVRHDSERALRSYRKALASFEVIGDQMGQVQTLLALGNTCFTRGHFEEAASYYQRSLGPREAMGDRWGLANSLTNLGIVEYHLGRWGSALSHLDAAVGYRNELGDRLGSVESALALGALSAVLGDVAAAEKHFDEAARAAETLGDSRKRARALLSTACLLLWADDREGATEHLRVVRTLSIAEPSIRARLLLLEGLVSFRSNAHAAVATLQESLDEARRSGATTEEASAHLALAGLHLQVDQAEQAAVHLGTAMDLVRSAGALLLELHGLHLRSALEQRRDRGQDPSRRRTDEDIAALIQRLSQDEPPGRTRRDFREPLFPLP